MGAKRASGSKERSGGAAKVERSFEALFAILWDALADVLGTAATSTLVHRAARRAARLCPELDELVITRKNLDYSYNPPPAWKDRKGDPPLALRALVRELRPLLVDLTGNVVINHLARIPELRGHGLIFEQEEPS